MSQILLIILRYMVPNSWTDGLLEYSKISTESFWQGLPSDENKFVGCHKGFVAYKLLKKSQGPILLR